METVCNKTEGKAKSKMGRRCEEWFEEDGGDQLETKDAGAEAMERNNWVSQNSQRVVELKEEEEEKLWCNLRITFPFFWRCYRKLQIFVSQHTATHNSTARRS